MHEIDRYQPCQLLHGLACGHELACHVQQQISNHGDDDLYSDCVLGCADEAFDLQVLFDPFEEEFVLSAA